MLYILVFAFALVFGWCSSIAGAAGDEMFVIGNITPGRQLKPVGRLASGEMNISLLLSNGSTDQCYPAPRRAPDEAICYIYLSSYPSTRVMRVEIRSPGFKKYSLNLPNPAIDEGSDHSNRSINIGNVRLQRSDLPSIAQILYSRGTDASHRFGITLVNEAQREFLIRNVILRASLPNKTSDHCCCPPNAIFRIDDALRVVAGGETTKSISGNFKELVQGKDYVITASGAVEVDGCRGGQQLELNLPSSFLIPKHQYSALQIILPQYFKIADSFYGIHGIKSGHADTPPPKHLIGDGAVSQFGLFDFWLSTSDEDEL